MQKKPTLLQSMGIASSTALIAVNFTHPIEIIKTRQQVGSFNLYNMINKEGVFAFWKGIQPAWLREASYTTIKLGGYGPIRDIISNENSSKFYTKFLAGSLSGSIGSIVGNPFDVIKTKMMVSEKTNHSIFHIMHNLYTYQGLSGFYRGIEANIIRACVLNGTKMACYDEIKTLTNKYTGLDRENLGCQFISATGSGFFMACTVTPFDNLRTRLMNQPSRDKLYSGVIDAAFKITKQEGFTWSYRGFFPIWARFAPQATLQLVIFDNLLLLSGFKTI